MSTAPDAQRLLASLPLAVVLLAPGQKIASANPAAEQFFGQSLRRLTGRSLFDWLSFDEPRLSERVGDNEIAGIRPRNRRDGCGTGAAPARSDRGARSSTSRAGRCSPCTIPARPRPWARIRAGSTRRCCAAPEVLAHEIKNPLAGIRGAAQLLGREADERTRRLPA